MKECSFSIESTVQGLAISPDGDRLAVVGQEESAHVYNLESRKEIAKLKVSAHGAKAVAWSNDGKKLVIGDRKSTIRVWSTDKWELLHRISGRGGEILHARFSPNDDQLAWCEGRLIHVRDTKNWSQIPKRLGHRQRISHLTFTADDKHLISASRSGRIIVWNVTNADESFRLKTTNPDLLTMAFTRDGHAATGHQNGKIELWHLALQGKIDTIQASKSEIRSVRFVPGTDQLHVATVGGHFSRWDYQKRRKIADRIQGKSWSLHKILCFPNGDAIPEEQLSRSWNSSRLPSEQSMMSVDSRTMLLPGLSKLQLIESATGSVIQTIRARGSDRIDSFCFTPRILVWTQDNGVQVLWDLIRNREIRRWKSERRYTLAAISGDEKHLALARVDGTIDLLTLPSISPQVKKEVLKATPVSLWKELADAEAKRAREIHRHMVSRGEPTIRLLKAKLHPVTKAELARAKDLVNYLIHGNLEKRKRATILLRRLGPLAHPQIETGLLARLTLAQTRRLRKLLEDDQRWNREQLRYWRAIHILEDLATPSARRILKKLCQGHPESRISQTALGSLRRSLLPPP